MQKFLSLKRDCPICSGARRDCRQNTQTNLVHCRHDIDSAPGWRFVGPDVLGFNMWAVDDGRNHDDRLSREFQQQQEARRQQRSSEEAKLRAKLLPIEERDRQYRTLNQQLTFSARHRQTLRERGLTDAEIDFAVELGAVRTCNPGQPIAGVSPDLAGIDPTGITRRLIGSDGFTIAAFDPSGAITGFQRKTDKGEPKYNWVSSEWKGGNGPHLPNGELPLFVRKHPTATSISEVWLCEGALKSMLVAFQLWRQGRTDIAVIGTATSARFGEQTLQAYLCQLDAQTIRLMPDAGATANPTIHRANQETLERCQQLGYAVTVGWWGQVDKSHPDIDEVSFEAISYLTVDNFLAMGDGESRGSHTFSGLFGWLPRLKQLIQNRRRSPWGFGRKSEAEVEPIPAKTVPVLEYQPGERLDVWAGAKKRGFRYILDTSGTGTGKSYDAGRVSPGTFGLDRAFYLSAEHRNPSTPTLKEKPDLESRHDGLYRDEFGKLRRVTEKQQPYVVPPNCGRLDTINALRNKNIPGSDTAELICKTCPSLEPCKAGATYNYLNQRAIKLKEEEWLRGHPNSLPSPLSEDDTEPFDYAGIVLLWDEASQLIKYHRPIEVRAVDLDRAIADLATKLPEEFDKLRPVLTTLKQFLSGEIKQSNRYGFKDAEIRQLIAFPTDVDIDLIWETLAPDLGGLLDTEEEYGVSQADMPRQVRKLFSEADRTTSEKVKRDLALNWLPDFLEVLAGITKGGSFRIQYGTLTLTLPDSRLAEIAQAAGANIFLDATIAPEDLALILGCDPSEILVVRQAVPEVNNVEIIQVTTVGRLGVGSERSDFCKGRIEALIDQIQKDLRANVPVFDFKSQSKEGDGTRHWWTGSRGVNDLEEAKALILVGTPCQNIAELEAEFTVLHGRTPIPGTERIKYAIKVKGKPSEDLPSWFEMEVSVDPEFRAFVRRRILADTHQAIGRLRANRRPGEQLKVYFIADYPLDLPVTLAKASDITPEAATKQERFEMAVKGAVEQLKATGKKVTQTAIAAITGYSQQHISRARVLLISLLEPYSKMSKNCEPPPDPDEVEWASSKYLPLLADSPPDELLERVWDLVDVYGKQGFRFIWDAAPATAQIKILQVLMLVLPASDLRGLVLPASD